MDFNTYLAFKEQEERLDELLMILNELHDKIDFLLTGDAGTETTNYDDKPPAMTSDYATPKTPVEPRRMDDKESLPEHLVPPKPPVKGVVRERT